MAHFHPTESAIEHWIELWGRRTMSAMNNRATNPGWLWVFAATACGGGQSFDDGRDGLSRLDTNHEPTECDGCQVSDGDDPVGSGGVDERGARSTQLANGNGVPGTLQATTAACEGVEYPHVARREAWLGLSNDFGDLTGRSFSGYVEGGPDLTLEIDDAGNATLLVGEPALSPVAGEGYLCGTGPQDGIQCGMRRDSTPIEGATYPLHGATFDGVRLVMPIQRNSPYHDWCVMQAPLGEDCFFTPVGLFAFGVTPSESSCWHVEEGNSVDCGWLELGGYDACSCTETDCIATIHEATDMSIDARYDEESREISGSFIDGERERPRLYLFEDDE